MPRGPSPAPRGRTSTSAVQRQVLMASATPPQMIYSLPSVYPSASDPEPVTHFQSPSVDPLQDSLGHTPQPHGHNYSATAFSSPLARPQVSPNATGGGN